MMPNMIQWDDALDDAADSAWAEVAASHTHQFVAERCLVCGCGRPYDDHSEDLPTLQPDVPASAAPHPDVKQAQLSLTACPECGKDADSITETGYWYTGMVCPQCGHGFVVADERALVVDELRALRADVTQAMAADYVRWAEHEIVRGAGGKIIGNIYNGVFHPVGDHITHADVKDALALHSPGTTVHQALSAYVQKGHDAVRDAQARYVAAHDAVQHHQALATAEAAQGHFTGPAHDAFDAALTARGAAMTALKSAIAQHGVPDDETLMPHQVAYWQDQQKLAALETKTDDLEQQLDRATEYVADVRANPSHTPQELAEAEQHLTDARHAYASHIEAIRDLTAHIAQNPVTQHIATLPPTVTTKNDDTQHVAEALFGHSMPVQEYAAIVGAQRGDLVTVEYQGARAIKVRLYGGKTSYEAERTIEYHNWHLVIHNDAFVVDNPGGGMGTRIFAAEVVGAANAGIERIETIGGKGYAVLLGRDVYMNGYATWPRLGYNGDLDASFAYRAEQALGTPVVTVRDLITTPDGKDYWDDRGYQIDLTFDLTPGSDDRQWLKQYLDAHGMNSAGVERMQQADGQHPQWVDLDWSDDDEAAFQKTLEWYRQHKAQQAAQHPPAPTTDTPTPQA